MINASNDSSLYELSLFELKNISKNSPTTPQISSLLKNKDISSILCLSKIISSVSCFDDICQRYFSMLIELYKDEMNIYKQRNIILANSLIAQFIHVFYDNFQINNDKHKSVLKQIPTFLCVYIKLFQNSIDMMINQGLFKEIESFYMTIIQGINYYPILFRSLQKIIEELLRKVFLTYTLNTNINSSNMNMKVFYLAYSILFRLSSVQDVKFNQDITAIIFNIKILFEYFKAREISFEIQKEKNKVLIVDIFKLDQDNLIQAIRASNVLFNLLQELFYLPINNHIIQIKYQSLLSFYYDNLLLCEKDNNCLYSIQGLSKLNYQLFLNYIYQFTLDHLTFHFETNSTYLQFQFIILNKIMNKIIFNDIAIKHSYLLNSLIKLYITIIQTMTMYYPDIIDQIIFSFTFNVFPSIYLDFLEKSDKTVIKIDNTLFKLGNKKSKMSLIEKSHLGDKLRSMANFSKKEIENIVILFLKLLKSFFISNHYSQIDNSKSLLTSLIDLIILPPYAKFIFYLSNDIKDSMIDFIESLINYPSFEEIVSKDKIAQFCIGFYDNNNNVNNINKYKLFKMVNQLNSDTSEMKSNKGACATELIIDFNSKIAQKLKDNSQIFIEKFIPNNNTIQEEKKKTNGVDNDIHDFLQKKRKINKITDNDLNNNEKEQSPRKGEVKWQKASKQLYSNQKIYQSEDNITLITSEDITNKEITNKERIHQEKKQQSSYSNMMIENDDEVEVPDLI